LDAPKTTGARPATRANRTKPGEALVARTKLIAGCVLAGLVLACSAAAHAADGPQWPNLNGDTAQWPDFARQPVRYLPPRKPVSAIDGEFGARYWFSIGKTAKNLYDIPGSAMVSRLTYDGLRGHSVEGFGRADHTSGVYVKGYLGGGIVTKGDLNDEDFEPFIVPYSSTMSNHKDGQMLYGSVDLGFNFVRNHNIRVGAFAGYHYFQEQVNAYGCTQVATNPLVCGGGGVPYNIKGITQDNTYHSLRVGIDADIRLSDHWSLRLDAAYLPHVILHGADTHWLRVGTNPGDFTGPVREDGKGHGYQLEAALNYAVNKNVSFAIGGRYWHLETKGDTHFEGSVVGFAASPQPVEWKSDIYGVYVQGSFRFGPYVAGAPY
jgi:outer membrane protease